MLSETWAPSSAQIRHTGHSYTQLGSRLQQPKSDPIMTHSDPILTPPNSTSSQSRQKSPKRVKKNKVHQCRFCEKTYSKNSHMHRHMKKCRHRPAVSTSSQTAEESKIIIVNDSTKRNPRKTNSSSISTTSGDSTSPVKGTHMTARGKGRNVEFQVKETETGRSNQYVIVVSDGGGLQEFDISHGNSHTLTPSELLIQQLVRKKTKCANHTSRR